MRTAKATIAAVYFGCPNGCEDSITDWNGSLMYEINQVEATVTCYECGEELRVPKWVLDKGAK